MDRASDGRRAAGRRTHLDERWETTSRGRFGKCGRAAAADARESFDSAALAIFLVFVFLLTTTRRGQFAFRIGPAMMLYIYCRRGARVFDFNFLP